MAGGEISTRYKSCEVRDEIRKSEKQKTAQR